MTKLKEFLTRLSSIIHENVKGESKEIRLDAREEKGVSNANHEFIYFVQIHAGIDSHRQIRSFNQIQKSAPTATQKSENNTVSSRLSTAS